MIIISIFGESIYLFTYNPNLHSKKAKTIWMERDDGLRYRETQNHIPININTMQSSSGDENLISHITALWTREIHTTQGFLLIFFLSELVQIEWKHDNLSKEKEMCQKIYSKWQVIIIIFVGSLECICARQWFRFFSYSNLSYQLLSIYYIIVFNIVCWSLLKFTCHLRMKIFWKKTHKTKL